MKLYDLTVSPYTARVRIQIRHKKLPVEITDPPFALRSSEFLDAFPLGKIPLLALDDNTTLAESTVIMQYLEAVFPEEPRLIPDAPVACAHNGMLIRCIDNHLAYALSPLFAELMNPPGDQDSIAAGLDKLHGELNKLEKLLIYLPDFHARSLQTADICMATNLYYAAEIADWFGTTAILDKFPTLVAWRQWVNEIEAVSETVNEMGQAAQAYFFKRS